MVLRFLLLLGLFLLDALLFFFLPLALLFSLLLFFGLLGGFFLRLLGGRLVVSLLFLLYI